MISKKLLKLSRVFLVVAISLLSIISVNSMDVENAQNNSKSAVSSTWPHCFRMWEVVSNAWTEEAKLYETEKWKQLNNQFSEVLKKWENIDKIDNEPTQDDLPSANESLPKIYYNIQKQLYQCGDSSLYHSPLSFSVRCSATANKTPLNIPDNFRTKNSLNKSENDPMCRIF